MTDPDDEPMSDYDVACTTDGCVNENIILRVSARATDPVIICGPCGNQITDVVPASDD